MASQIITQLNGGVALTTPASGDKIPITDISDTTEAASGTTKPITLLDALKIIFGDFALSGDISPSQITANQNDYNPTGLATAAVLRLSTDASRNITSIAGGSDGRILIIHNIGSFNIVLKDDDGATGTAANRFALSGDVTLAPDQCAILQYDSTSSRWRCVAASRATSGVGSGDVTGPSSSTDNALVRFDSTTGKLIQDSTVTLDDTGAITVPEMAAPSTPASNKVAIYAKSDGKLYIKDDAGTETDLTATGTVAGSPFELVVACSDLTTALTTGTAKNTFPWPRAVSLTSVHAFLVTPQTSGSVFTVDVNEGGVSILSTKITIDNGESDSTTAATPPVISDASLAAMASITVDIDQVGDGTAKGLYLVFVGTRA